MFTAYFDASGHQDGTDCVVVAGFVAPVQQWIKFDKDWHNILNKYHVSALHMKDFAHSRGEFSSWKKDKLKRRDFLGSLISVIKRRASYSFASGIDMKAFKEEGVGDIDSRFSPYALGGITSIHRTVSWSKQIQLPEKDLRIVFEDGDKGKGNLLDLSSDFMCVTPIFEPKQYHRAFQAADLLAYEVFLTQGKIAKLSEEEKLQVDSLRKPFQSLRSVHGSRQWGFKNKDTFRHLVENRLEGYSQRFK